MFARGIRIALAALLLGLAPGAPAAAGNFDWIGRVELDAEGLSSSEAAQRHAAVVALAGYDPALAKPYLLRALQDDEDGVRIEAGKALGRGGIVEAVPEIVDWLGDIDPKVRGAAAEILGDLGTEEGTQALIRSLGDTDPGVRVRAVGALGKIGRRGDTSVVVPLVSRLDDDKTDVRSAAIKELQEIGDRRAVIPMVAALGDTSIEVRKAAIRALGTLGDPAAVPPLLRLLDDPSDDIRALAVAALGTLGAADATSPLVERLDNSSDTLRGKIALALGQIARTGAGGRAAQEALRTLVESLAVHNHRNAAREALKVAGPAAVPALVEHLDGRIAGDPREAVTLLREAADARATAALVAELDRGRVPATIVLEALAATGDPAAIVPVLGLTSSSDPALRLAAMNALRPLLGGDARAADVLIERLGDDELEVRVMAIEYLGLLRASRAAARLAELAGPGNPLRVRLAAIDALGEIGEPSAAPGLVDVIREGPVELHAAAATALSYLASPDTVGDLVELARGDRSASRHHVVRALAAVVRGQAGGSHAPTARRLFEELADGAAAPTAIAAIAGLAALGDRAATPALVELLGAAGPDRQRAAAWALGELQDPAAVDALVDALDSKDDRVTADVAWALGEIASGSADGRAAVVARALPALTRAAKKGGWATTIDATGALARVAEPSTARDLARQLHHKSKLVRVNAVIGVAALARHRGAVEAGDVTALRRLLADDASPRVRGAAAWALGALAAAGGAGGVTADDLRAALASSASSDRDEAVRAAAAGAAREPAARPPRDEWRVFYVVDPTSDDKPVREEPYFLIGADGLVWATYTDARGQVTTEHFPAGDAVVAPQSRETEH